MILQVDKRLCMVMNEGGFTYCNCLLIDDDVRTIIDTGADQDSLSEIRPETVDMVLNSHHHYDHIRGNQLFSRAARKIHALDFMAVQNEEESMFFNSFDRWSELMPGCDFEAGREQMNISDRVSVNELKADSSFENGDVFDFGHLSCEVVHTPGHSAGHCAFWFPDQDFMFLGDICLTATGPWYGEVCASMDDLAASIDKIIAMNPGRIATGHVNRVYTDAVPRLQAYKQRIASREERLLECLKGGELSLQELAGKHLIYRLHPTMFVMFWEKLMLDKHLERLELAGLVACTPEGKYYAI